MNKEENLNLYSDLGLELVAKLFLNHIIVEQNLYYEIEMNLLKKIASTKLCQFFIILFSTSVSDLIKLTIINKNNVFFQI